jgi:hypothetical protein
LKRTHSEASFKVKTFYIPECCRYAESRVSLTRAPEKRIKQILDCLTFEEFVEGPRTHQELKRALDKMKTRIIKLTQQCEPASRGSEHQLYHLRRAVVGQPWSELALQAFPPFNDMNKLVAALGAAIQHDATKMALQKTVARSSALPILFQVQQQLRNPTYGNTQNWSEENMYQLTSLTAEPEPQIVSQGAIVVLEIHPRS